MSTDPYSPRRDFTDQQLYESLHDTDPHAFSAWTELNHLHWARTFTYARIVLGRAGDDAEGVTDTAFTRLADDAGWGRPLSRPLRLYLLTLVEAAARERAPEPKGPDAVHDIAGCAETAAPGDSLVRGFVARGFAALSPRRQALLWYSLVEQEGDARVAQLSGVRREAVRPLVAKSLLACSEAALHLHYNRRPTPGCSSFARLLTAATRYGDSRTDAGLARHLDACPWCRAAMDGLVGLRQDPRLLLARSLLGHLGHAYLASLPTPARSTEDTVLIRPRHTRPRAWRRVAPAVGRGLEPLLKRRGLLVGLATVVVLTAGTVHLVSERTAAPAREIQAMPEAPPTVRKPAPVPDRPSRSPYPHEPTEGPATVTASPPTPPSVPASEPPRRNPPPSANASEDAPRHESAVTRPFQGQEFVAAVHADTHLCLDVRDGVFANGTDVVVERCMKSADSQLWRVERSGLVRNGEQPAYCLDARGPDQSGVGIWSCEALEHNEQGLRNLSFSVDSTGRIQALRAPDLALAPDRDRPGTPVVLSALDSAPHHNWIESVNTADGG
ncbi:ricin-type beta-trefoil lectin domain protein [Streptomyces sp. NPDC048290]|uniref:ricin-type beta-trefoil lectin domain protein n=1 Tax=Streptomyces sp. NPDC048290 TaxID=3155811 RepID=UPI00341B6DEC